MIDKIIHQIWIGDKSKKPEKLMHTWKELHRDWEYILWDEEKIDALGLSNKKQYDLSPTFAGKSDIARYEILYKFGGFFIDADSICLKKIPDSFLNCNFITTYESEKYRPNLLANGFIGTKKKNKIVYDLNNVVRHIEDEHLRTEHPWKTTGPLTFSLVVKQNAHLEPILLESKIMLPEHFDSNGFTFLDMSKFDNKMYELIKDRYPEAAAYQFWGSTKGKY